MSQVMSTMERSSRTFKVCLICGELRVKDVSSQLQTLISADVFPYGACSICSVPLEPPQVHDATESINTKAVKTEPGHSTDDFCEKNGEEITDAPLLNKNTDFVDNECLSCKNKGKRERQNSKAEKATQVDIEKQGDYHYSTNKNVSLLSDLASSRAITVDDGNEINTGLSEKVSGVKSEAKRSKKRKRNQKTTGVGRGGHDTSKSKKIPLLPGVVKKQPLIQERAEDYGRSKDVNEDISNERRIGKDSNSFVTANDVGKVRRSSDDNESALNVAGDENQGDKNAEVRQKEITGTDEDAYSTNEKQEDNVGDDMGDRNMKVGRKKMTGEDNKDTYASANDKKQVSEGDSDDEEEEDESDANDPSYKPDGTIGDESSDDDDDDATERISSKKVELVDKMDTKLSPNKYINMGTKGVHPKLVEMMQPSTNPKRPFACKLCSDQEFAQLLVFQKHLQTHTGEEPMAKPFYCTSCETGFALREEYVKHSYRHSGERPYKCAYEGCTATFTRQGDLNKHGKIHSEEKSFKCQYCEKRFVQKVQVEIHERYHTGEKLFKCTICNKSFYTKRGLQEHETLHTGEKPYKCQLCDYRCRLDKMLKTHQKVHKQKQFQCERCLHVFTHEFRIKAHRKLNKCVPPKTPKVIEMEMEVEDVNVEIVDISSVTECLDPEIVELLDSPQSRHKPYRCKACKKIQFHCIGSFVKHASTHVPGGYNQPKPYSCPEAECKFRGRYWNALERHKVSHVMVRPFKCKHPGCSAAFQSHGRLQIHSKIHTQVKRYMCEICGNAYPTVQKVNQHKFVHTDEKPEKCSQCDKSFKYKMQLKRHMRRIHGNQDYNIVCETCGKAFKNKECLASHRQVHSGEKPYHCSYCSYRSYRKENVKKHIKLVHFKEPKNPKTVKYELKIEPDDNPLVEDDGIVGVVLKQVL